MTKILYKRRKVLGDLASRTYTIEWKAEDLWIGVFYKTMTSTIDKKRIRWRPWRAPFLDVYVIIIPTVVFHYHRVK